MKILVVVEEVGEFLYGDSIRKYSETREDIDIDVYCLDAHRKLGSLNKIRYKKNFLGFRKEFWDKEREKLAVLAEQYDQIVFYSLTYDEYAGWFIQGKLKDVLNGKFCKLYFLDTAKKMRHIEFIDLFDELFVFEEQDVEYFHKKYNRNAIIHDAGTSYYLFKEIIESVQEKRYDISFVGTSVPKRLKYLTAVAEYCLQNNKKLFIAGHFWHNSNIINYTIGKWKFRLKYPVLYKFVKNEYVDPHNVARIYASSKISLNIIRIYYIIQLLYKKIIRFYKKKKILKN